MPLKFPAGRVSASILALAASVAILPAQGCSRAGGAGATEDRHNYPSTTHSPKTIRVVDSRSGEVLWSFDVPVGQKLSLKFDEGEYENEVLPDRMRWGLGPISGDPGLDLGEMAVPDSTSRRLEMELREAPEYPSAGTGEG
ncbi:MAG: hypothetical protein AAGG07_00340 [Planctomycetota bacterium]